MKKSIFGLLFFILTGTIYGQEKMPEWFMENMEQSIGIWIADNTTYKSENEPFDQYGMDWEWGIGKQSITGKLYGLIAGQKQGVYWEFRQYWDYDKDQGVVVQYGPNGTVGIGPLTVKNEMDTELVQEFVTPQGLKTIHGHRSTLEGGKLVTASFDISEDDQ